MTMLSDSDLSKAMRFALRKRDRVKRIVRALSFAAWEANTQGRIHPARGGQSPDEMERVRTAFEATAIRELRKK